MKPTVKPRFQPKKLAHAANLLKSVVHPTRLNIIDVLDQKQDLSVTDLSKILNLPHALTSHHLNDMKSKSILKTRREGQLILYSIKEKGILSLLKCISNF